MRHRKARSDFDRCAASALEETGQSQLRKANQRPVASRDRTAACSAGISRETHADQSCTTTKRNCFARGTSKVTADTQVKGAAVQPMTVCEPLPHGLFSPDEPESRIALQYQSAPRRWSTEQRPHVLQCRERNKYSTTRTGEKWSKQQAKRAETGDA